MLPKDLILLTPTRYQYHHPNGKLFHQYSHRSSVKSTSYQIRLHSMIRPWQHIQYISIQNSWYEHSWLVDTTSARVKKDRTALQTNTIAITSIYMHRRSGMSKATPIDENHALHHGFASKKQEFSQSVPKRHKRSAALFQAYLWSFIGI